MSPLWAGKLVVENVPTFSPGEEVAVKFMPYQDSRQNKRNFNWGSGISIHFSFDFDNFSNCSHQ